MSGTPRKRSQKPPGSPGSTPPAAKIIKVDPSQVVVDPNTATLEPASSVPPEVLLEIENEDSNTSSPQPEDNKPSFVFKDPNFKHSSKGSATSKRARVWKNLKQIVSAERALPWKPEETTYGTIGAPPSFKPAKKYSDMSGLPTSYTDPHSKLRYATSEEYARIPYMPSDIVGGYLALRKASGIVG